MFPVLVVVLCLSSISNGQPDPAATHGMLLFGEEAIYLSHLPMFHRPHDYQVILKVKLPSNDRTTYLKDKTNHPDEMVYTLVPERFVLPKLIAKPFAFKGALFRGHFERGGTEILPIVMVTVENVVFAKKLIPTAKRPELSQYILFGEGAEYFTAHSIAGKPNFDHIVRVNVKNAGMIKKLKTLPFLTLEFPKVDDKKPLNGQAVLARILGEEEEDLLVLMQELYLEFGDLEM